MKLDRGTQREVGVSGKVIRSRGIAGCTVLTFTGWVCENCGRANCRFRWEVWVSHAPLAVR